MNILDNLITYWSYFTVLSFIVGIVGFIINFLKYRYAEENNSKPNYKLGFILMGQLVVVFASLFILHSVFTHFVKKEIKETLISPQHITLVENMNFSFKETEELETKLCNIIDPQTNHSAPEKLFIKVIIKNNSNKFFLRLGRDNQDSTLYWIFVDNYKVSNKNDIGKIRTGIFEGKSSR